LRVAVYGGGGFIGSAVADRLLGDGHALRIFEREGVAPYRQFKLGESVEWLTGNLMHKQDVHGAMEGVDAVVHLVSTTLPKKSNEDPVFDVQSNVVGTLQLLESMVALGIPRIVFISSGGTVYGSPKYLPIDEDHPTDPQVSYGITKLTIEKYLLMYGRLHGIRPIILRVANPYGERQRVENAQGAVAAFIHHALARQPIPIWGDGSVTRDFLHVSDVAEAFACALDYSGAESVFNISSGAGLSLNGLIARIELALARPVAREYLPSRAFDVPASVLKNDRARRELDWQPRIGIDEGIARTLAWARITREIHE
jgi:UDP-glucose 4-epimerase